MQKSLKTNLFMNTVLTAANLLFPLITYSHVARVLTPLGTGKVAFVQANLAYFGYIATLGIPAYGLRECAKVREDKAQLSHTAQELLIINLFSTLAAYLLLLLSVNLIPQFQSHQKLFAIMSMGMLLKTLGMEWLYKALEEYSFLTVVMLVFKCVVVGLTFLLIRTQDDFYLYGLLTIFAQGALGLCCMFRARRHISLRKTLPYSLKRHLKPIALLFSTSLIITIYAHFDVSMLGFLRGEYEVGLYNAALKIKNVAMSAGIATTAVFIPRIAAYGKQKREDDVGRLVTVSMQISLCTVLPLLVLMILFARPILGFICGADYLDAEYTLQLLALCMIPQTVANICGNQLLVPLGHEKRFTQSVFVGMLINLTLNFCLIPYLGAVGAVLGTIATECWNVFWMGMGVKRYCRRMLQEVQYGKYAFSICCAALAGWLANRMLHFPSAVWQLIVCGGIFFAVYFGGLVLLKEPLVCRLLKQVKEKLDLVNGKRNHG